MKVPRSARVGLDPDVGEQLRLQLRLQGVDHLRCEVGRRLNWVRRLRFGLEQVLPDEDQPLVLQGLGHPAP